MLNFLMFNYFAKWFPVHLKQLELLTVSCSERMKMCVVLRHESLIVSSFNKFVSKFPAVSKTKIKSPIRICENTFSMPLTLSVIEINDDDLKYWKCFSRSSLKPKFCSIFVFHWSKFFLVMMELSCMRRSEGTCRWMTETKIHFQIKSSLIQPWALSPRGISRRAKVHTGFDLHSQSWCGFYYTNKMTNSNEWKIIFT